MIVLEAVVLLVLGAAGGWFARGQHDHHGVRVSRTVTGTVSKLNGDQGRGGCITVSDGGKELCSAFAVAGGGTVAVGQRVHAALEWVDTPGGGNYDLLLLYPLTSP